jgi:hypothetical protein
VEAVFYYAQDCQTGGRYKRRWFNEPFLRINDAGTDFADKPILCVNLKEIDTSKGVIVFGNDEMQGETLFLKCGTSRSHSTAMHANAHV